MKQGLLPTNALLLKHRTSFTFVALFLLASVIQTEEAFSFKPGDYRQCILPFTNSADANILRNHRYTVVNSLRYTGSASGRDYRSSGRDWRSFEVPVKGLDFSLALFEKEITISIAGQSHQLRRHTHEWLDAETRIVFRTTDHNPYFFILNVDGTAQATHAFRNETHFFDISFQ